MKYQTYNPQTYSYINKAFRPEKEIPNQELYNFLVRQDAIKNLKYRCLKKSKR